jgi:hypothetical protein
MLFSDCLVSLLPSVATVACSKCSKLIILTVSFATLVANGKKTKIFILSFCYSSLRSVAGKTVFATLATLLHLLRFDRSALQAILPLANVQKTVFALATLGNGFTLEV